MAVTNLSGSSIQDTYQQVIHTDGANFYDGTGSLVEIVTSDMTGSHLDSLWEESGSSIIPKSSKPIVVSDITSSGDISASGTIVGSNLSGANTGDQSLVHLAVTGSNVLFGHITASGNISASGDGYFNDLYVDDDILISNNSFLYADLANGSSQPILGVNALNETSISNTNTDTVIRGATIDLQANVTASGNISSSGNIIGNIKGTWDGDVIPSAKLDTDTAHLSGTQTFTGLKTINYRVFAAPGNDNGDICGDVVFFGTSTVTGGKIYFYDADGLSGNCWTLTDATTVANSKGLLAVAMGVGTGTASLVGMCIKGRVNLSSVPGTAAEVLYLSEITTGKATSTAPTGNNEVVRIIGYALDDSGNDVWFDPDHTYVEVTV